MINYDMINIYIMIFHIPFFTSWLLSRTVTFVLHASYKYMK